MPTIVARGEPKRPAMPRRVGLISRGYRSSEREKALATPQHSTDAIGWGDLRLHHFS